MYVEDKSGGLVGPARVGRVTFSKTGRTLYYGGRTFQSLKGGYKANYFDTLTGDRFWISGPKRGGGDGLYGGEALIRIDEDVREEYWREIRRCPDPHAPHSNLSPPPVPSSLTPSPMAR